MQSHYEEYKDQKEIKETKSGTITLTESHRFANFPPTSDEISLPTSNQTNENEEVEENLLVKLLEYMDNHENTGGVPVNFLNQLITDIKWHIHSSNNEAAIKIQNYLDLHFSEKPRPFVLELKDIILPHLKKPKLFSSCYEKLYPLEPDLQTEPTRNRCFFFEVNPKEKTTTIEKPKLENVEEKRAIKLVSRNRFA